MKGKRYPPIAVAKDSVARGVSVTPVSFPKALLFIIFTLSFFASACYADISGQDVLILVNSNSPTSRYIAKLYRQYHPDVPANQVLYLSDMNDCSGKTATSGDEIITRAKYNQCIATPVRQYLLDAAHPERIARIKVIVTTAGMPYRIKDSNPAFDSVVTPAASNGTLVQNNRTTITAASVESELTCLWYSDYGSNPFGLENRIVNPYQGYRNSSISLFARTYPGTKQMQWNYGYTFSYPPKMEGQVSVYGTINRQFNAGDMFFVCRLDGPKLQGQSAIFAVRNMLERAKRASSSSIGVNAAKAVVIFDEGTSPITGINKNRIYNLNSSVNFWVFDPCVPQPPDAPAILTKDDYIEGYNAMTNYAFFDDNRFNHAFMPAAWDVNVIFDTRSQITTTQADLATNQFVLLFTNYGLNGNEGKTKTYLLTGGPSGGALFNLTNGAVFTSMESFNAVTMFSNAITTQAKIIDFITIGGCGAIGHAFEPISDATIDNQFLFYNLLTDNDDDGVADLTFVEAAYSAIPYLSWSEVVIGDPLMRIHYGPGGSQAFDTANYSGDINFDGVINAKDVREFKKAYDGNGDLYNTNSTRFDNYNDLTDFNHDYKIDIKDVRMLKIEL
jgi:hypothetical protein